MKWAFGVCCILLAQISCISSAQPAGQSTEYTKPQLVFGLNGSGDINIGVDSETTQGFHINKGEWVIETNCEALDATNSIYFNVSAYPEGELVNDNNCIGFVLQSSPGTKTSYVHKAGDFYLVIGAINVKEWSVKVYQ